MDIIKLIKEKWKIIIVGLVIGGCIDVGFVITSKTINALPSILNYSININLNFTIGQLLWTFLPFTLFFILICGVYFGFIEWIHKPTLRS